jgi:WD40 repeat protein
MVIPVTVGADGGLTKTSGVDTGVVFGNGATDIVVTPDGKWVYVANKPSVVIFARDATTGGLGSPSTFTNNQVDRLSASPDGMNLYISTAASTDKILALTIDASDGGLSQTTGTNPVQIDDAGNAVCNVASSPDGYHVYVASAAHTIQAFDRDRTTGLLTAGPVLAANTGTFNGPVDSAVSPNGKVVIALGSANLVSYSREIEDRNCAVTWSACSAGSRTITAITTYPSGNGVVCPASPGSCSGDSGASALSVAPLAASALLALYL